MGSSENMTKWTNLPASIQEIIQQMQALLNLFKRFGPPGFVDGPVYAADVGAVAIFQVNGIQTGAPSSGEYPPATQADYLQDPADVFYCIYDHGIYVLDWGLGQLLKFNTLADISNGNPATAWGGLGPGSGAQQFTQPGSVIVDSALNKYVADSGNNRIQWIAPNGQWTSLYGPSGKQGYLNAPCGLAMDSTGALIVADTNNHRLVRIADPTSANPGWTTCAGAQNPLGKSDSFQYPGQVAVASNGTIYVVDWYESAVETPGGSAVAGANATRLIAITDFTGAGWAVNANVTNSAYGVAAGSALIYVTQGAEILMFNGIADSNPTSYSLNGADDLYGISVPVFLNP
jgi:DNA-binding beta-propeller fold protein YncE